MDYTNDEILKRVEKARSDSAERIDSLRSDLINLEDKFLDSKKYKLRLLGISMVTIPITAITILGLLKAPELVVILIGVVGTAAIVLTGVNIIDKNS